MATKIEWADEKWNPITGCTPISEGCEHCYAKRMAKRLAGRYGYPKDNPFRPGTVHRDKLDEPNKWKKPRKIFVCSMGDLFNAEVPYYLIDDIFETIRKLERHIFIVLTKRAERMFSWAYSTNARYDDLLSRCKNLWLGVTAENQRAADERIPFLLQVPAAIKFVSVEPMLEPIDLDKQSDFSPMDCCAEWLEYLDWIICGAETGPGARKIDKHWVYSLYQQARRFGVPFFFKKWGPHYNSDMISMTGVREFPNE